jgi:homoserine O-succinyltransferase
MLVSDQLTDDRRLITVALVNNMPDAAFVDTEDQFRGMVKAGSDGDTVELKLYTIAGTVRSRATTLVIQKRYAGLDQLWANPPDALIITGTEPTRAQLSYEPYWPSLARLLNWAAESVPTTLLSCLASHASVLLFDGIDRIPRPVKASGVYAGLIADPDDPLVRGLPEFVQVPHSRVNDVSEAALRAAGYRIVVGSCGDRIGWSVATRRQGDSLFVLCQGHPEYSTLSLLREYRRDVRRHLLHRGLQPYPRLPDGYLCAAAEDQLRAFADRARAPHGDSRRLWATFPYEEIAAGVRNTWSETSTMFYSNWLREARMSLPAHATARV